MADVLDVPLGTVKSRLHYAKLALRNILSPGNDHGQ
jgi:DNA-directed RNA polymerase specialized sigma24 family protein